MSEEVSMRLPTFIRFFIKKEEVVQLLVKLVSCVIEDPPKSDEKISEESVLSIIRLRVKYIISCVAVQYSSYESGITVVTLLAIPPGVIGIMNNVDEFAVV